MLNTCWILGFMNFTCWCSSCEFLREGAIYFKWQFISNITSDLKNKKTKKQQTNKKEHFYFWIFASDNGRFLKEYFLDEDDDYDDDNDTASISMTHNGTRKITLIYVNCVTEKLLLHVQ